MISTRLLTWACTLSVIFAAACESGVGDPCVPEDEFSKGFSGFSENLVFVESRSFQCQTRICLVNHFEGRVSCPYGQTTDDLAKPATDPDRCRIPGTTLPVEVPVAPQRSARQADDAVYCSCRCDGPDKNARYCDCPSGYGCVKLIDDYGIGSGQLAGSYCVKDGTAYRAGDARLRIKCGDPGAPACSSTGQNP